MPIEFQIVLAILGAIYVLPAAIAFFRKHPNRWLILVICIAFGATLLGWLIALVWSLSAVHRSSTGNHGGESGLNIFANDVRTVRLEPGLASPAIDPHSDNPKPAQGNDRVRAAAPDPIDQLTKLKALFDQGVLEKDEYERLRRQIIGTTG